MVIRLIRQPSDVNCTFGVMFVNGYFECFTLENTARIIPAGGYNITLYDSPKNKRIVPLLHNVPDRSKIEIHIANFPYELEGCIAVGNKIGKEMLMNSTVTFNKFMSKVKMNDALSIIIENPL